MGPSVDVSWGPSSVSVFPEPGGTVSLYDFVSNEERTTLGMVLVRIDTVRDAIIANQVEQRRDSLARTAAAHNRVVWDVLNGMGPNTTPPGEEICTAQCFPKAQPP